MARGNGHQKPRPTRAAYRGTFRQPRARSRGDGTLIGTCLGCDVKPITGQPDPKHISTSYVERQNLTMRMSMRRFTRLTNAFSKKIENHAHAVALYFTHYNFARIHRTLRVTPAMEAGVSDHVWELDELVELLDRAEFIAA